MSTTGPTPDISRIGGASLPTSLPFVGRAPDLATLEAILEGRPRTGSAVLLSGDSGAGKSRLATEFVERAQRRGWSVARGRAYAVESGVPYALLSDAFLPILRGMDENALSVLSRGGEAELRYLFPALGHGDSASLRVGAGDPDEFRTRLLWNFSEFVKSYAARSPLIVVLEALHWADPSSLELVHFLARQVAGHPVLILCSYADTGRERSASLVQMERSLLSLGIAQVHHLEPLSRDDVTELVCRTFNADTDLVGDFSAMLFGWTRGNLFYLEEILRSLVRSGSLSYDKGTWLGWDARDLAVPASVRDAVRANLSAYSQNAQATAELAAVLGTRASYPFLESISGLEGPALLAALEELCTYGLLAEHTEGGAVVFDFRQPLVRETLYREVGLQRARILHGTVAEAMEAYWGDEALNHADELAYHFARADTAKQAPKARKYLSAAGRKALRRHADREAADYLQAALRLSVAADSPEEISERATTLKDLARAHRRMGEYGIASDLWSEALAQCPAGTADHAALRRRLGLAAFWRGHRTEAFTHFQEGLDSADVAHDRAGAVRLRLARSHCLQAVGRGGEAMADIQAALPDAEALDSPRILGRVYRSLALLHVWIGPPATAEMHARRAIELAQESGDLSVEFWARWGLAVLWGMTGDTARMAEGVAEATELAEKLRSPVLRLWTAEMSIELAYGTGNWASGIALGEQSIALARDLNQKTLLPRLLAWTSLFYTGRGDLDRARALVDEACDVSGMHRTDGPTDVHLVVPAYIGLAHYRVGLGDYAGAITAARKGLDIADGTGYTLWAMHRLLPILGEACLWAGEIDEAEVVGRTMREHAQALDHKLGIAWADAADALVRWRRGDPEGGALAMRGAAEALERIPMIPYAVRIRRQLAGRLAEIGDVEGSLAELRQVQDVFAQLGAEGELEKVRIQFRELGHRPPPRGSGKGMAGLTEREVETARLVARRRSNKAIGKELGISPRTVSTHLSNIFQKLSVSSRAELGDLIRAEGLLED